MKLIHNEGRFTMRPGVYNLKDLEDEDRSPVLTVSGFITDEGGEVRVLAEELAVRPLARTIVRHYWVPQ